MRLFEILYYRQVLKSRYLADTGLLSDHRGDPEYVSWDEALAAFLERVAE